MTINLSWLSGKKTYLVGACIGVVAMAQYLGWIDLTVTTLLYGLLGATGTVTMRQAINKI